jgi:hypothetical protein
MKGERKGTPFNELFEDTHDRIASITSGASTPLNADGAFDIGFDFWICSNTETSKRTELASFPFKKKHRGRDTVASLTPARLASPIDEIVIDDRVNEPRTSGPLHE